MAKRDILCTFHAIIDHQLLGPGTWPAHREFLAGFYKMVHDLGLNEEVPGCPRTTRSTALGREFKLDLLMAFVGAWDPWEIPYILEKYGFIDEPEAEEVLIGSPSEVERNLRRHVVRAYLKFCNRFSPLN